MVCLYYLNKKTWNINMGVNVCVVYIQTFSKVYKYNEPSSWDLKLYCVSVPAAVRPLTSS